MEANSFLQQVVPVKRAEMIWLVGCFGFNGPLRQYFSLYRAVSQREGERGEKRIDESKTVQTTHTRTDYKRSRPLPFCYPNCRTPRHCKFIQHHRTTQPPPGGNEMVELLPLNLYLFTLTLLHSKRPKLHRVLVVLSAIGLKSIGKK